MEVSIATKPAISESVQAVANAVRRFDRVRIWHVLEVTSHAGEALRQPGPHPYFIATSPVHMERSQHDPRPGRRAGRLGGQAGTFTDNVERLPLRRPLTSCAGCSRR